MTELQLASLLENITGHLASGAEGQQMLEAAQRSIAVSLLQSDDTGTEQLFASSDLYAREKIPADQLTRIASIASDVIKQQQPELQKAFIRTTAVRNVQVAGSIADWAIGAKPAQTFGPFLNIEGREIWIDIFKVVKLNVLYLGTTPVLLFKAITNKKIVIGPPALATDYTIVEGSVWINARLLSAAAPADRFAGVKVKGGILKLSLPPTLVGTNVTLNPAGNFNLNLQLVQDTDEGAAEASPYGKDARDVVAQMPENWSLTWNGTTKRISQAAASDAHVEVYGQSLNYALPATPDPAIVYNALLNSILIPWKPDATSFAVARCQSPFFTLSGTAAILNSYWSLPCATLDINSPLEAKGNGGLLIECDMGLRASWQNLRSEDARLTKPYVAVSAGSIFVVDLLSDISGAAQHVDLWKDEINPHRSSFDLSFTDKAIFLYSSASEKPAEMLGTTCSCDLQADRPVKVNGEGFPVLGKSSVLLLSANDLRRLVYLYDDNLITDNVMGKLKMPVITPGAIALENALFTVSQPASLMIFGEANETWSAITRANVFISFYLYRYLPTLPDPYIGNLKIWERLFGGRDGNFRVTLAEGMPAMMLIGKVSYSRIDENSDDVDLGFHFGTLSAGNVSELPKPAAPVNADEKPLADRISAVGSTSQLVSLTTIKTSIKINAASIEKAVADNNALLQKLTLQPGVSGFVQGVDTPVLNTNLTGDALSHAIAETMKGFNYEDFWNNAAAGSRVNSDPFALLDVSSNANQMGISVSGQMVIIKTGNVVRGANNQNAVVPSTGFPFIVDGMQVKAPGSLVRSFTLPQFAWEPVSNLTPPDREDPFNPLSPKLLMDPEAGFLYYPDDGGPTRIWNNSTDAVALAPIPVVDSLLEDFKSNPKNYTVAAITLPFGLKAIGYISKHFIEPQKPDILAIRPKFRQQPDGSYKLEGGIQLSLQAGIFGKTFPEPGQDDSPMFPGYTIQLNNLLNIVGLPSQASNLGHRVTEIFNNEFIFGVLSTSAKLQDSRGVPVTRMDITGYGANMFSKWFSPSAAMAQTSQARFDVMMGRTAHEVIQVKSILYPWGIRVVRTITVFRVSTAFVYRTDSGWKAESDGKFDFSYRYKKKGAPPFTKDKNDFISVDQPYEFHPGVIRGLFNVRNIKDAPSVAEYTATNDIPNNTDYLNGIKGQILTNTSGTTLHEPVKCGGVFFDADVEIENVVQGHIERRVVSKKILGYVQVAPAGKPLTPLQLRDLLNLQNNSIGGDADCVVDLNKSDQQMRLNRFDVGASVDAANNPVFVVAGRGNVVLPKDGSWTMVQHNAGTGDVIPLPVGVTVPLIRTGKWKKNDVIDPLVVQNALLRIAHPLEILRPPAASTINFGYLQSTATQKALFLTPAYGLNQKMLLSKTPPVFADAYRLMTGSGIFPNVGNAIDNFGKNMPLLNGKDSAGNAATAFVTNALSDGSVKVLELMQIQAEKAGETVIRQGMSMLQKGANGLLDKALSFDVPPFEIPLVDMDGLRVYVEYQTKKKTDPPASFVDSKLHFDVDSFSNDMEKQWKSRLNNLAMVVDLGSMKRLMTIKGNFDSHKGKETGYEGGPDDATDGLPIPEIEFSDALQPVIEILEILAQLSTGDYGAAMKKGLKIAMSNSGEIWEYKFEANKEIPIVRFPPIPEVYNSAQTPLKLEASLGIGVYFNAALKVTSSPGQLLPTAGAYLKFHGGLSVMCFSVGVASIYALGTVDVKIACDTKVGPSLALAFGFGVQIVVSLPVVGNVSVSYMVAIEMYVDKDKIIIAALLRFRGSAELLEGLVCVAITIEAKGIVKKEGDRTDATAQVTFAIDISIFLVIDISFSKSWSESRQIA